MPSALWRVKSSACQVGVGDVGFPSACVDGLFGVIFHPFHGGVGAGLVVPGAGVDEGGGGWEGHV